MFWGGHVWRPEDKLKESGLFPLCTSQGLYSGFRLASKHLIHQASSSAQEKIFLYKVQTTTNKRSKRLIPNSL